MFISINNNYLAMLMENLNNTKPFPMTNQEKQQKSFRKASNMLEDDRPAININY